MGSAHASFGRFLALALSRSQIGAAELHTVVLLNFSSRAQFRLPFAFYISRFIISRVPEMCIICNARDMDCVWCVISTLGLLSPLAEAASLICGLSSGPFIALKQRCDISLWPNRPDSASLARLRIFLEVAYAMLDPPSYRDSEGKLGKFFGIGRVKVAGSAQITRFHVGAQAI